MFSYIVIQWVTDDLDVLVDAVVTGNKRADAGKCRFVKSEMKLWNRMAVGALEALQCKYYDFRKRERKVIMGVRSEGILEGVCGK